MGGLGESISTKMADAGYRVVVTYSPAQQERGEPVAAEMKAKGYDFHAVPRATSPTTSRARQCVAKITADVGPIDILVNNAGITRDMTFKKMGKADWDAVMRTNLDSVFNMTKQVCDGMVERGWGRDHQRVFGERLEGRVRPDQLLGGQGRHARLHQVAGAGSGARRA